MARNFLFPNVDHLTGSIFVGDHMRASGIYFGKALLRFSLAGC